MSAQTGLTEPPVADAPPPAEPRRLVGRAVRGGVLLMAARLGMQAFVWGVTLFVARLLQPADYGMMTAGMIFLGLADLLAEAGVGKALVQKRDLGPVDVSRAFTFSLMLAAGLYAVLFAGAGLAGDFLTIDGFGLFLRVLALLVLL